MKGSSFVKKYFGYWFAMTYVLSLLWLSSVWYKDYTSFHFFDDLFEWEYLDKLGHFFASFQVGLFFYKVLGVPDNLNPSLKKKMGLLRRIFPVAADRNFGWLLAELRRLPCRLVGEWVRWFVLLLPHHLQSTRRYTTKIFVSHYFIQFDPAGNAGCNFSATNAQGLQRANLLAFIGLE